MPAIRLRLLTPLVLLASVGWSTSDAQVRAVYDNGAGGLARQLQRLQTTGSVLHTGAHPDDEDSALVAYHARGLHARTAYLSLTRGSGGQNIIGAEQSDLLGVIRSEELLQARRLDGADQYFSRAVDFGYSKHLAEAERMWGTEAVLDDMVRAIRQFRPRVIVSRWQGTAADGHGHHQFAGYLTPLAYAAAADPERFPGHMASGLSPWKADKLYVAVRPGSGENLLEVNTGQYDPMSGHSFFEIGMQGRSQQKTQQMGQLELRGPQFSYLRLEDSRVTTEGTETSIFAGIDTSIAGIAAFEPARNRALERALRRLQSTLDRALGSYDPLRPGDLVPELATGLQLAREAQQYAAGNESRRLLATKIAEIEQALVMAAGITIDALADTETVIPGDTVAVAIRVYAAAPETLQIVDVGLQLPEGWQYRPSEQQGLDNERRLRRKEQADFTTLLDVSVPMNARPTQPYWLQKPRNSFLYDWSAAGRSATRPFDEAIAIATTRLAIGNQELTVRTDVKFRKVDRVRGELRRNVNVLPGLSVEPVSDLLLLPVPETGKRYPASLTVHNNTSDVIRGEARFDLPDGWRLEPASAAFQLAAQPASATLSFDILPPDRLQPGRYLATAVASAGRTEFRQAMHEIAYPHIDTHRSYAPAEITIRAIDARIAPVRVAYVMGSGDKVPEALGRLGIDVTLLDDDALTAGDLGRFDTIVVGIRASQTRPAFVANNRRLLDFAAGGGALIVQYQQADYIEKNLAPFSAEMSRPVRVVDETAPVRILAPEHPAFTFPNRISQADFEGWVQERNNHNFTDFDRDHYVPLTESHDPGEPESVGGMVYARIGSGHYVYTGYSWFRQLPNGVPGAYRLFANLLSLPAAE